jgi:membrane fusion protein (multidrug efflux system)
MDQRLFLKNVCIFLLTIALLGGCKDSHKKDSSTPETLPPVKVQLIAVEKIQMANQIEILGTVQAAKRAVISSRISGNIVELLVAPGSRVHHGEKLVQINAEEISARLMQAKAQLDQASRNLQREQKLLAKKAATPETVKGLEDGEKIARANYQGARTMLSYTMISAPFDGLITRKLIDVGDLATPGKPLLHIENVNNLQVMADVPETIVENIHLNMEMQITIPTSNLTIQGTVSEIAPAADPRSRTVPIKLSIENHKSLRSGQFARVTLPGAEVQTILVPAEGILPLGQMERVFIAVDGKARLRLVRTGKRYQQGVEILSGLSPGDTLIITTNKLLKDGQPIVFQ